MHKKKKPEFKNPYDDPMKNWIESGKNLGKKFKDD